MRKVAYLMLLILSILLITACGKKEFDYEQSLLDQSQIVKQDIKNEIEIATMQGVDVSITVKKISDNTYESTYDGVTRENRFSRQPKDTIEIKQVCELDKKFQNIALNARENVIKYINSSNILREKEVLIKSINEINVNFADLPAAGLYRDDTIYINKDWLNDFPTSVIEYSLTHEYIHALAAITNGGIENEVYGRKNLNEAITDIITVQLVPNVDFSNYQSGYADYYYNVLGYIACFKEKAIEAYFYGYNDIWQITGRDEFDFFVEMFGHAPKNNTSNAYCIALINKWLY